MDREEELNNAILSLEGLRARLTRLSVSVIEVKALSAGIRALKLERAILRGINGGEV